jgi:hypothetical protein
MYAAVEEDECGSVLALAAAAAGSFILLMTKKKFSTSSLDAPGLCVVDDITALLPPDLVCSSDLQGEF